MSSIFDGLTPLATGAPPVPANNLSTGTFNYNPLALLPNAPPIGPQGTGIQPNDIADPGPDTMPNSWITFWDNIKYGEARTCRDSNGIFDRSNCQIPGPMLSTYLALKGKGYNFDGWAANYAPPNARDKFANDEDIDLADRQLVLENIGSSSGGPSGGLFGNGDFNPLMLSLMQSMFSGGGIDIGQMMMMGILFPDMFGDSFNIGGGMLDQCNGDTMCELMLAQLMQSIVGGFGGGGGGGSFFPLG